MSRETARATVANHLRLIAMCVPSALLRACLHAALLAAELERS